MPKRVALGISGLDAGPGDHICGVFSSEAQRDQVLIPFLQAGLASGDKCICVGAESITHPGWQNGRS